MSLEKYVITSGPDKGRIKDLDISHDLAHTEDAWREERGGNPMLTPPERLGKSEFHFRDLVNEELKDLIRIKLEEELDSGFDSIYSDPVLRDADPESSDERWLSYRLANRLTSIGEEHGFDDETCYEILEMPFPEGFETAYSYLTQAGLDADEVLSEFTAEPQE